MIQNPNLDPVLHLVLRKLVAAVPPKPKVAWNSGQQVTDDLLPAALST